MTLNEQLNQALDLAIELDMEIRKAQTMTERETTKGAKEMNSEQRKLLQEVAFGLGAIRGAVRNCIKTHSTERITSTLDEIEPKIAEVLVAATWASTPNSQSISSLACALDMLERRLTTAEEQIAGIKKGDE